MLALEIRFLTGRYAAGRHDDTRAAEWPPHPARVYSALTAAVHEVEDQPAEDERAALEWLACAGAPEIVAPQAHTRHIGNVFVPVNDSKGLDSIDRHLLAVAEAERDVGLVEGKARPKAEKRLAKEEEKLRQRSVATAAASRMAPASAAELLDRPRHPRFFPVVLPVVDIVQMRWRGEPPEGVTAVLDRICARVSRLGHPSSLVSMRLVDVDSELPANSPRWVPDPEGREFIRIPHDDQLRLLEDAYEIHRGTEPRVLPAHPAPYVVLSGAVTPEDIPSSEFTASEREWLLYEVVPAPGERRRHLLDLSLAQQVARALRGALLSALDGNAPEVVSGHAAQGGPATRTHVAFVPLADVGHPHATGSILGVAVVPPRSMDAHDRDRLLEGVYRAEQGSADEAGAEPTTGRLRLTLGRHGVLQLQRLREPSRLQTLDPGRWCQPAARWTTATAVALDRNPGPLLSRDPGEAEHATAEAERTIANASVRIGLPEPLAVWLHRRSLLEGAPPARRFAPFPDGGNGPRRVCIHAEILFERPVRGPILLGAGRYFGLGLAMPYEREPEAHR